MSIQGIDNENLLNINLLPEEFIRERIRRRNNRQQRGTAILFLLIVGVCSWQHFERSRRLQIERDHTVQSVGQITSQLQSPAGSRAELDALEAKASLITFLRVRGLPTQVFHMLDETRPENLILSTLKLSRSTARNKPSRITNNLPPTPSQTPVPEGIQKDLAKLEREAREHRQELRLEGDAPDDLAVARFLGKLRRYPLCEDVKLEFTDSHPTGDDSASRRFAIVVTLKSPLEIFDKAQPDSRDVAAAPPRNSLYQSANSSPTGEIR